ncbi:hypothetical protein [Ureibacillus manganicus]|uniref:Sporulation protein YqfC n=1 Tax=Ureibacillus manganicus DSM 26584 TaxID=1384049 RepID=A0A0A3I741_9BACL|nr:hypothetical protein [Ureibacillus manganicus]KGR78538.1 hypothetical protein CD29_10855 [Ureibacillus manganicus DSM 26584]
MKKLFQTEPLLELFNCNELRIIGQYKFLEASSGHCLFLYEQFYIQVKAKKVHIDVLKVEELILHVEDLESIEMKKQGDSL